MHKTDSRWIVISERNAWGSDPDLRTALANANLNEVTALDHFRHYLDRDELTASQLGNAMDDWNEYGWEEWREQRTDNKPVAVVLVWFDSTKWDGWDVSPMDGGVSFYGYQGDDDGAEGAMRAATLNAYWHQGVLSPRTDKS